MSQATAAKPQKLKQTTKAKLPMVLDLDGSLLKTDMLYECLVLFLKRKPWNVWKLPYWLTKGKANLKRELAQETDLNVATLPLNEDVVAYARFEAENGREVLIATASDVHLARKLAQGLDFVSEVIGSEPGRNLKGAQKAELLKQRFPDGFAYLGDSDADLPLVDAAKEVILVNPSARLKAAATRQGKLSHCFEAAPKNLKFYTKVARLHQWAKNALLFVPFTLAGMAADPKAWGLTLLGFLAIGIMASATYLLNDLWDLEADRQHWSKRNRPLASGRLQIFDALWLIPVGIIGSLAMGAMLGLQAFICLSIYLVTTVAYSLHLKRFAFVDTITLASLFTLRLALGVAVVSAPVSPWLFVFSMFLFLSLSIAKRHTEVLRSISQDTDLKLAQRGYRHGDEGLLVGFGAAAGMAATLVMVLYLTNEAFNATFYTLPQALWALPPLLFLWLSRIWLVSQRGELNDDPVVFATKDKQSLAVVGLMGVIFAIAWLGGAVV